MAGMREAMGLGTRGPKSWRQYAHMPSTDDFLKTFGLETRRSALDYALPALGIFGAGVLVGAGLGMLFAPKRGEETRDELARRMGVTHGGRPIGSHEPHEAGTSY